MNYFSSAGWEKPHPNYIKLRDFWYILILIENPFYSKFSQAIGKYKIERTLVQFLSPVDS